MSNDIPAWAIDRMDLLVADEDRDAEPQLLTRIGRAFARYIASKEEAPVDPLLIEARKLVADSNVFRSNNQMQAILDGHAGTVQVAIALAALKRGMELAKAGSHE